jgi:hypothetical protein
MRVGLHVEDKHGAGAKLITKLGWSNPPPIGAPWACCRRSDVPTARVREVEWAGLAPDPDVWVMMNANAQLVDHLVDKHGFDPVRR